MPSVDIQVLMDELEPAALAGLSGADREAGRDHLRVIATDWAREAGSDPNPQPILAIFKGDFAAALEGKGAPERLQALATLALTTRVEGLRRESWALGTAVIDGRLDAAEARRQGEALLARVASLTPEVRALVESAARPLLRGLEDAMLEALYAVEKKAMSFRLGHYSDQKAPR